MVFTVDTMIAMCIKVKDATGTLGSVLRQMILLCAQDLFQLSVAAKNEWQKGQTDVDKTPARVSNEVDTFQIRQ
jgi:hypothetical protein